MDTITFKTLMNKINGGQLEMNSDLFGCCPFYADVTKRDKNRTRKILEVTGKRTPETDGFFFPTF